MRGLFSAAAGLLLASLTIAAPAPAPEVDLDGAASRFHYYTMPTPEAGPCDITTGPDGKIYVQYFLVNKIGIIDPATGHIEELTIPYKNLPLNISLPGEAPGRSGVSACAIQPGSDGNVYAASGVRNEFVKIDLATKKVSVFQNNNVLGNLEPFNDLWRGATGMWFSQTTADLISHFDYKTEVIKSYKVPTAASGPLGMIVPADGNLWFVEFFASKVAKLNTTTHEFTEYAIPTAGLGPVVMRAETVQNGNNYIWFVSLTSSTIGRVNIKTGAIEIIPAAVPAQLPVEDDSDSYGRVWYSAASTNTLNVLNPYNKNKITVIKQPNSITGAPVGTPPAANIAIHYGPQNKMWFTQLSLNKVGTYQLYGCGKNYKPCTANQS